MTYYKYVKREVDSQVDWSAVGKKISDSLIQVRDEREKRRNEIEEASRQFGDQLANAPQGENKKFNEFVNEAARDTAELRRIQDNLLRSGMMKTRDYTRGRQNLTDGWTNFAKLGEEYNTEWAEKMARAQNGEGSLQELYEMEQLEGFANFTEAKMYIDPMTGNISLGHRVKSDEGYGTEIDMEQPLMEINEMRERLKRKINRYDVIGGLTPVVNALGQNVEVLRRAGIETLDDITQRSLSDDQKRAVSLFRSAQENALNSILSSPDVASSIMSDYVNVVDGQQVRFTSNEEELSEGNHVMLLKRNEKSGDLFFEPTEAQREILFNALRDQMDIMLDIKETPMDRDFQAERENRESGKTTEEQTPRISNLAQLWYGNSNEVDEAVKFLGNLKPELIGGKDIQFIDRLEDKVVITYRVNGEERTQDLDFYDDEGNLKTQEEFIKGYSSFFGISDVSKALSRSEYDPNREFGTGTGRFEIKRPVEPIKPFDEQFEVIDSQPVSITELLSEVNQNTQPSTVVSTVRSSFKGLPEDKKRGLDTEVVKYKPGFLSASTNLLKIFLPQVMDQPVFIPKEGGSFNGDLQSVLNRIYDAAANNEMINTDSDLGGFITNYDEYNTANIRSLYGTTTGGSAGSGGSGGSGAGDIDTSIDYDETN